MPPTSAPAATERVYDHVKTRVLDHTYAGGDLLTEGEIASAVGVSRTPVREALLRLEAEGLLRLYPKRGALVVPVTAQEAGEVLEARTVIETWAAGRAVDAGPALVERLADLLEEMRRHQAAGDVTAFVAADRAYHEAVVGAAGNSILTKVYGSLRDRQLCMSAATINVDPRRITAALEDHERLLDALRARDLETFRTLTAAHIASAAPHDRNAS